MSLRRNTRLPLAYLAHISIMGRTRTRFTAVSHLLVKNNLALWRWRSIKNCCQEDLVRSVTLTNVRLVFGLEKSNFTPHCSWLKIFAFLGWTKSSLTLLLKNQTGLEQINTCLVSTFHFRMIDDLLGRFSQHNRTWNENCVVLVCCWWLVFATYLIRYLFHSITF